ncbi:MAG: hypothetical protein L0271_03335, partial [Gemmatimonadetes bacterium]|nr:hypothetical protein [Gemmatimonadota bacterium]
MIAGLLGAALVFLVWTYSDTLAHASLMTGWTLLGVCVILSIYNLRKKLTFLPMLGTSAAWLQAHLSLGWLSFLLFFLHTGFRVPTGAFERVLAGLFLLAAVSGVAGIFLSRGLAKRITTRGEGALFERIPVYHRRLRERAEEIVVQSVAEGDATTLADFYATRLLDFFQGPRHFWSHL